MTEFRLQVNSIDRLAMKRRTCQKCGSEAEVLKHKLINKGTSQFYRFYYKCSCGKKFKRDYDCTRH